MRSLLKSVFRVVPMIPFLFNRNFGAEDDLQDQACQDQIQTTINKIFLTSLQSEFSNLKIFAFDAQMLGKQVTSHLDIGLGRHITGKFNDGEVNIQLLDSVRGHKVYIIKSFEAQHINDGIIELILAVSCMKKEGAESVTCIIPYFPYSLSTIASNYDLSQGRDFYTCFGADIVKMLESSGCDEIITLNSFMSSPKGFAQESRFQNIQAPQLVVPYLIHSHLQDPIIIGARSNRLHIRNVYELYKTFTLFDFNCGMGFFNNNDYIGEEVKDRDVLLFTNIIRTGETIREQATELKKKGAKNIYCFGFHSLCSHQQVDQLVQELPIKEMIMTNTVYQPKEVNLCINQNKKIRTISIAKLLAEIITILQEEKSLSQYRGEREMMHYAYLQKIRVLNKQRNQEDKKTKPPSSKMDQL